MNIAIRPPAKLLQLQYGDERIAIERLPRTSGINKVKIKVHPDCTVAVTAPENASDEDVLVAVKKRSRWIYQQLRDFRQQMEHVTPRKYVSGETHYYLGKRYMLKVITAPEAEPTVKLLRGTIELTVRKNQAEVVRELLSSWYKTRAKEVFAKRLDAMLEQALWVSERPSLRIQTMQTQWGSCSPSGRLTLNPHLVKTARECIDYVILHELCHIAEHNHSERFYRLLAQVMPKWKSIKERLDSLAFFVL